MTNLIFYISAGLAVLASLGAVYSKNLFHAVLSLGLLLLTTSGLYMLLGADFVAMVQIFVYVGGVVVLLLFGFMLVKRALENEEPLNYKRKIAALLASLSLLLFLLYIIGNSKVSVVSPKLTENSTLVIGRAFLTTYLLPFEVIAIILLVAVIGAVAIWGKER